jgi:hypothetical protein
MTERGPDPRGGHFGGFARGPAPVVPLWNHTPTWKGPQAGRPEVGVRSGQRHDAPWVPRTRRAPTERKLRPDLPRATAHAGRTRTAADARTSGSERRRRWTVRARRMGRAATTGGQRPQRCGTATDEGNPSRGMNRAVGTADETRDLRVLGSEARNTENLMAGSRAQQTCNGRAEKAVGAVRNRRDGTGPDAWQRPAEGCRQRHPGVDARSHVG